MLSSACILVVSLAMMGAPAPPTDGNEPAAKAPATAPATDLDYWLSRAKPVAATRPAATTQPADTGAGSNPFKSSKRLFRRADALPGVIELSDGSQLPGGLYTTVEKPWIVWSEATKSWRRVGFLTLLSIEAVVEQERMELTWRWKGMGEPEKF